MHAAVTMLHAACQRLQLPPHTADGFDACRVSDRREVGREKIHGLRGAVLKGDVRGIGVEHGLRRGGAADKAENNGCHAFITAARSCNFGEHVARTGA